MSRFGERTSVGTNRKVAGLGKAPASTPTISGIEYLVVGSGGGGLRGVEGSQDGSGGGGGGQATGSNFNAVKGTTYTVRIGAGGQRDSNGVSSSITDGAWQTLTAGGGFVGANGATGGVGGIAQTTGSAGGAGTFRTTGNAGTAGTANSITGSSVTRGGGGGGACDGAGGSGGGGAGGSFNATNPVAGTANSGGGGGGGSDGNSRFGAAGGSGVVIIKTLDSVADASTLTGGTKTTPAGYKLYTFNSSGTIGWS